MYIVNKFSVFGLLGAVALATKPQNSESTDAVTGEEGQEQQWPEQMVDTSMTCEWSATPFGEVMKKSDCKCADDRLELSKHACCMVGTESMFGAAAQHKESYEFDAYLGQVWYYVNQGIEEYMNKKRGSSKMWKMMEWMKEYKKKKNGWSPFDGLKTLLLEFGADSETKMKMMKLLGVEDKVKFIFAEGADKQAIDDAYVEEGNEQYMLNGWRMMMKHVISNAMLSADSENEAMEFFRMLNDKQNLMKKMAMKGEKFTYYDVLSTMYDYREYKDELRPIDVVRCTLVYFMAVGEEMKEMQGKVTLSNETLAAHDAGMPDNDEAEFFWELLDVIELAYDSPLAAEGKLMSLMMSHTVKWSEMDAEMDAEERKEMLDALWCQLTGKYTKEVLKVVKCYGYSEFYYWNLIDEKINNGNEDAVTIPGFATNGNARLPTKEEMWQVWATAETNSWNLTDEQLTWWTVTLEEITTGIIESGLNVAQPSCEKPQPEGWGGMMGMKMGGMMGGMGGPPDMGGKPDMGGMDGPMGKPDMDKWDDRREMMMNKMDYLMKQNQAAQEASPKWQWFDQNDDMAARPSLTFDFAGETYSLQLKQWYQPKRYVGFVFTDAAAGPIVSGYGNRIIVSKTERSERKCLSGVEVPMQKGDPDIKHLEMAWMDCDFFTGEEDDGAQGVYQHFYYCSKTGQIQVKALENTCLTVMTFGRDWQLSTCACKGGMSRAVSFGKRNDEL